jgi:hypothetical protein
MVGEMCSRGGAMAALATAVAISVLAWFLRWLGFDVPGAAAPARPQEPEPVKPADPKAMHSADPGKWPPSNLMGVFLLGLLLPAFATAGVTIDGPATVQPGMMARLNLAGAKPGAAVRWDVQPVGHAGRHDRDGGGTRLLVTGEPGTYRVTALSISGTVKDGVVVMEFEEAAFTLKVEGAAVPPVIPPVVPPVVPPGKADPRAALGRLSVGSTGCTCTVIGPRRSDGRWDVLTASHCWPSGATRGTVRLPDSRVIAVTLAGREASSDIAWMTTDKAYDDLPFAMLAKEIPAPGSAIWHAGYGVDRPGNLEEGTILAGEAKNRQLSFNLNVSSGDSGGGIFRKDTGELLANVCCTRSIGSKTTMWGGSCIRAAELRPKAAASHEGCQHPTLDLGKFFWDGGERPGGEASAARPGCLHPVLDLARQGWEG